MRFWKRSAKLQVGSSRYSLDELTFEFKVRVEDRPKVGIAEIKITNLAMATRNSITKGTPIILNAGYRGDVGLIFAGRVEEFESDFGETAIITKITAADTLEEWMNREVNKTYQPGTTADEIKDDLLGVFGVEVAVAELAEPKTYPRGRVCRGKVKDVLKEIAVSDCSSRFMIRNGQVVINAPEEGVGMGYYLSRETGLLKGNDQAEQHATNAQSDIPQHKSDEKQKEPEGTLKRVCLLNYHLGCADIVVIEDSAASGQYLIKALTHEGSPSGKWETALEVVPA